MNPLIHWRAEIDQINESLALQLRHRFQLLKQIREYKKSNQLPPHDPGREAEMWQKVLKHCRTPEEQDYVKGIFKTIFEQSLEQIKND